VAPFTQNDVLPSNSEEKTLYSMILPHGTSALPLDTAIKLEIPGYRWHRHVGIAFVLNGSISLGFTNSSTI
jgi:hypothetical protein